jgi:hypothetical protein
LLSITGSVTAIAAPATGVSDRRMATRSVPPNALRDTDTGRFFRPAVTALQHAELYAVWSAAHAEANVALDEWRESPGPETYAVYRAAEDRADAAQDALAGLC